MSNNVNLDQVFVDDEALAVVGIKSVEKELPGVKNPTSHDSNNTKNTNDSLVDVDNTNQIKAMRYRSRNYHGLILDIISGFLFYLSVVIIVILVSLRLHEDISTKYSIIFIPAYISFSYEIVIYVYSWYMYYLDVNTNSIFQKIYEYKTISLIVFIDLILMLITSILMPINLDGSIDIPYYTIAFPLWIIWLTYFLVVGVYYLIKTPINSLLLSFNSLCIVFGVFLIIGCFQFYLIFLEFDKPLEFYCIPAFIVDFIFIIVGLYLVYGTFMRTINPFISFLFTGVPYAVMFKALWLLKNNDVRISWIFMFTPLYWWLGCYGLSCFYFAQLAKENIGKRL